MSAREMVTLTTHATLDDRFGADEDHIDPLHDISHCAIENHDGRDSSSRENLMRFGPSISGDAESALTPDILVGPL